MIILTYKCEEKEEKYYTHMLKVLNAIGGRNLEYNWLITDIEAYPQDNGELDKLIRENDYLFLSTDELISMLEKNDFQWIWGVFSAIPKEYTKEEVLKYELPFADGNYDIYKDLELAKKVHESKVEVFYSQMYRLKEILKYIQK